jgi:hypothetical protein
LKLINALVVAALVLFAAGLVHADDIGGDSRIVIGGAGPGSPSCTGFQAAADVDGVLSADCTVAPETLATSVTFAAPASEVLGGALSCTSELTAINWTATTATIDGGTVDTCTFTAPADPHGELAYLATPEGFAALLYADSHDPGPGPSHFDPGFNDGDCDLDDFLVGIPGAGLGGNPSNEGCDITFSSPAGASIANTQALTSGATYDVSPAGVGGLVPFPEPGTLALLMLGLVSLPFLRRRAAQQR